MWKAGRITRTPQGQSDLPTFRVPPPEIMEVVYRKLDDRTYGHYSDE